MLKEAFNRGHFCRGIPVETGFPVVELALFPSPAALRHMKFIRGHLHGLRKIKARALRIRGDGCDPLTDLDLRVRETAAFRTEHKRDVTGFRREEIAGAGSRGPEFLDRGTVLTVIPRKRPGKGNSIQRLSQRRD